MDVAPRLPARLAELVDDLEHADRTLRVDTLIEYADRFREAPAVVASRPFPDRNRAPRCESEAYVFATDREDGTLKLWFAVENPQGISAKAWAAILDESLSGEPLETVARVPQDVIFKLFGRELSMGKGQGLIGMLELVQQEARARLDAARRRAGGF
ncbi:MAG TPA: SufE family protein [Candidatus Eisenbacteria bacterium]